MEGDDSLFPHKRIGQEHIDMQRAIDPIASRLRQTTTSEPFGLWATEKWKAVEDKQNSWNEQGLRTILERTLMFDPKNRANTSALFQLPYFFPFITQDRIMDLREVETDDYKEIKQRIFDLQHGSCLRDGTVHAKVPDVSRKSQLQKMCSMAVQYFDGHVNESAIAMECDDE